MLYEYYKYFILILKLSMTEKLVSIVITVYNSQDFIGRYIDSVVSQTYNAIEIIVVDDGSIDRTLDVVNKYKSQFFRY